MSKYQDSVIRLNHESARILTQRLATIAIAGFFIFLAITIFMHFIHTEFDPSKRFVSEFILADYGWLLNIAIVGNLIGCTAFTLAFYRAYQKPYRSWTCIICLGIATLSVLTNFFPADIHGKAITTSGYVHNIGAFIGSLAILTVKVKFSVRMKLLGLLPGVYKVLIMLAMLAPIVFVILLSIVERLPGFIGVSQRIYILIIMAWLILASLGLRSGAILPRKI